MVDATENTPTATQTVESAAANEVNTSLTANGSPTVELVVRPPLTDHAVATSTTLEMTGQPEEYVWLVVRAHSAKGLLQKDNGMRSPYITMEMNGQLYRTHVCERASQPTWRDEFIFFISNWRQDVLHINIFDFDPVKKNDFLGKADLRVRLLRIIREGNGKLVSDRKWYVLEKKKPNSHPVTGVLLLETNIMRYEDLTPQLKQVLPKHNTRLSTPISPTTKFNVFKGYKLRIRIVEGRRLLQLSKSSALRFFVTTKVPGDKVRTKSRGNRDKQDVMNPIWDDTFYMSLDECNLQSNISFKIGITGAVGVIDMYILAGSLPIKSVWRQFKAQQEHQNNTQSQGTPETTIDEPIPNGSPLGAPNGGPPNGVGVDGAPLLDTPTSTPGPMQGGNEMFSLPVPAPITPMETAKDDLSRTEGHLQVGKPESAPQVFGSMAALAASNDGNREDTQSMRSNLDSKISNLQRRVGGGAVSGDANTVWIVLKRTTNRIKRIPPGVFFTSDPTLCVNIGLVREDELDINEKRSQSKHIPTGGDEQSSDEEDEDNDGDDENGSGDDDEDRGTLPDPDRTFPESDFPEAMKNVVITREVNVPASYLTEVMFDDRHPFFEDLQKVKGHTLEVISPWKEVDGKLQRKIPFAMPATRIVKATSGVETQIYEVNKPGFYVITAKVDTPDVPYGSTFFVQLQYVIAQQGKGKCKLRISGAAVFVKSTIMKGFISNQAGTGLSDSFQAFDKLLDNYLEQNPFGAGRKPRKARVGAALEPVAAITPAAVPALAAGVGAGLSTEQMLALFGMLGTILFLMIWMVYLMSSVLASLDRLVALEQTQTAAMYSLLLKEHGGPRT